MTPDTSHDPRIAIWNAWRQTALALGHQVHAQLQETSPVTVHGRDLRPDDEGVGFQFQYMLAGDLYNGDARAAFYVLQIQLKKRARSIGWEVDAVPVIERADNSYQLHQRRTFAILLHQHQRLRSTILDDVANDAATFFAAVSAALPFDGVSLQTQPVTTTQV